MLSFARYPRVFIWVPSTTCLDSLQAIPWCLPNLNKRTHMDKPQHFLLLYLLINLAYERKESWAISYLKDRIREYCRDFFLSQYCRELNDENEPTRVDYWRLKYWICSNTWMLPYQASMDGRQSVTAGSTSTPACEHKWDFSLVYDRRPWNVPLHPHCSHLHLSSTWWLSPHIMRGGMGDSHVESSHR